MLQRELVNTVPRLSVANSWHEKSQHEQFWYVPIPIDLSDVPWLIHDYGEPGIRTRYTYIDYVFIFS